MVKIDSTNPEPPTDLVYAIHLSGALDIPGMDLAPSEDGSKFVMVDETGEVYATLEDLEAGWLAVVRSKN